jgi:hypothetical protein
MTTLTVGEGAAKETVTVYVVTGWQNTPTPIWLDSKGRFFAQDSGLTWIRAGYESYREAIDKAQDEALAARSPGIARSLANALAGPVSFTHVRAFVDGTRFVEDQTVVADKGKIVAVGPAGQVTPPAGAQVIDGKGKTLVPGLWDAHQHFPDDGSGPMLLSLGITSIRDPGNNNALTLARAARRAKGDLRSCARPRPTVSPRSRSTAPSTPTGSRPPPPRRIGWGCMSMAICRQGCARRMPSTTAMTRSPISISS